MKQEYGRATLEYYASLGYLFHGSQNADIALLEPRVTDSKAERAPGVVFIEETPVISATENIDIAIFAATIWRRGRGTSGWYSEYKDDVLDVTFNASQGVIDEVLQPDSYGYVYVLPSKTFKRSKEMRAEFRSYEAVKPVVVVRVHAKDLRPDVTTLSEDKRSH